jgi:hypothetical protein
VPGLLGGEGQGTGGEALAAGRRTSTVAAAERMHEGEHGSHLFHEGLRSSRLGPSSGGGAYTRTLRPAVMRQHEESDSIH